MENKLSARLQSIVNALPLVEGMRVLEIGCGPGAAAREISNRIGNGTVIAIDRSPNAIKQAIAGSQELITAGRLRFLQVAIEELKWPPDEPLFDLAVAIRVGVLDGRHPKQHEQALAIIAAVLKPGAKLFIDGGNPLLELSLDNHRRKR